ncbi:ROK family protein [Caproiciproducens faecalis]|uniref:ROK family protein n=1 Tax=Caproiciproducens faecalis TaxID=2820301 RepID=A0ABS7DLJ1_9FIRM|nr:ROK family protein [Caproiciproducens faecalis]MBW7572148.1 ROK family protein [Caproiciproducens faecalis]
MLAIGIDIGGTKCAVNLGEVTESSAAVLHKCKVRKTAEYSPAQMLEALAQDVKSCLEKGNGQKIAGIGISCGGPLDSGKGIILSPPNLPGWDRIPVTEYFQRETGIPAWLCNDANACALAEWKLGAGKGTSNMVFITFGTGLGAGLILDNRLYAGAGDMAGEIGHIRLSDYGPAGYGKMGSFEGFCSGGGIAQLAQSMLREEFQMGHRPALCGSIGELGEITAAKVGAAAKNGDPLALEVLKRVGLQLGKGLSVLMDILNPECIVIGSIFVRNYEEIWPSTRKVIERETLPAARKACRILPSQLSESVGDIAGLMVAGYHLGWEY